MERALVVNEPIVSLVNKNAGAKAILNIINRIKGFAKKFREDAVDPDMLGDAVLDDFINETGAFAVYAYTLNGELVGHLLAAAVKSTWGNELSCVILQHQIDPILSVPIIIERKVLGSVVRWAEDNGMSAVTAIPLDRMAQRRLRIAYGFKEDPRRLFSLDVRGWGDGEGQRRREEYDEHSGKRPA